jgi:hypothetical protein
MSIVLRVLKAEFLKSILKERRGEFEKQPKRCLSLFQIMMRRYTGWSEPNCTEANWDKDKDLGRVNTISLMPKYAVRRKGNDPKGLILGKRYKAKPGCLL